MEIGRVDTISEVTRDGESAAVHLMWDPRYHLIPQCERRHQGDHGVRRYKMLGRLNPTKRRITPKDAVDGFVGTTEINTLFQTLTSIAEKVIRPVAVPTLSAAAVR